MCCRTRAGVVIFAAVNSLVQSAVCVAFGILVILMYNCILYPTPPQNVDNSIVPEPLTTFASSFYLQYFHSQNNCIAHRVEFWKDVNDTKTGQVTKSYQVEGIFIGYLVDNAVWLICSLLLFVGARAKSRWIFVAHSVSQFLIMIYDVIMIILFALDFKSYSEFLGNPKTPLITKDTMLVNIIVMLLIVSRFVLFFALNISTFCMMLQVINDLGKPKKPSRFAPGPIFQMPKPGYNQAHPQAGYAHGQILPTVIEQHEASPTNSRRYPDVVGQHYPRDVRFDESIDPHRRPYGGGTRSSSVFPQHNHPRDPPRQQYAASESYSGRAGSSAPSTSSAGRMMSHASSPRQQRSSKPKKYPKEDYYNDDSSSSHDNDRGYNLPRVSSDLNRGRSPPTAPINIPPGGSRYPPAVRRNSSQSSMGSEALKNQRPWSYISPNELPSAPNRLNQFYNNLNAKNERSTASARTLPSLVDGDESDSDYRHRPHSSNKEREYGLPHSQSVDFQEPLLPQPPPTTKPRPPVTENVYANIQKPAVKNKNGRKNVRFDHRAQSLDYLETTFPFDSPAESRKSRLKTSRTKTGSKEQRASVWGGSGEQVATNEFNFYRSAGKAPRLSMPLKRTPSKSSPDLVFDPISNTAHIVYRNDAKGVQPRPPCRQEGRKVIHASTCDGQACLSAHFNETSI